MTAVASVKPGEWINCELCRHRTGVGFDGLTDREAALMNALKDGHGVAAPGQFLERAAPGALFLTIYSGMALRLQPKADGLAHPLHLLLPGDHVGLETANAPGSLVRALTDVTYCRFRLDCMDQLLAKPELAVRLARVACEGNQRLSQDLAAAHGLGATGRVAYFLLRTHDELQRRRLVRDGSFELPLERRELAALVGLTPTHLRRVLRGLSIEGLLHIEGHRFTLPLPDGLRSRACGMAKPSTATALF